MNHAGNPFWHHGGVGAVWILATAEDVEVSETHAFHAVAAAKHIGIQLVHQLGHRVGRQRFADDVFDLGQAGVVAISRTGRRVNEALDLGIARGNQHVEIAGVVGGMGRQRVFERARHRAERGLVQYIIDALAGGVAGSEVADITTNEVKTRPAFRADAGLHLSQIFFVASGQVVESDHALIELQQGLCQIAANEAGDTRNEPDFRLGGELLFQRVERGHHSLQSAKPAAFTASGS